MGIIANSKKMRLTIILPGVITPSRNQIDSWLTTHNYKAINQIKKEYKILLISAKADEEKWQVKGTEKRRVEFWSYRPRLLDSDNLSGGMKYLRNMLTEMRLIYDDSPQYLDAKYYQVLERKASRTVLVIMDIRGGDK